MLLTKLGSEPSPTNVHILEAKSGDIVLRIELTRTLEYEATIWRGAKRIAGGVYRTEADARSFLTSVMDQSYG